MLVLARRAGPDRALPKAILRSSRRQRSPGAVGDERQAAGSGAAEAMRGLPPRARLHEELRLFQGDVQAAVLEALPSGVAVLDAGGRIVFVNAAWRAFAAANGLHDPEGGLGLDYIGLCERTNRANAAASPRRIKGPSREATFIRCSTLPSTHST